jgi:hypothetical protein
MLPTHQLSLFHPILLSVPQHFLLDFIRENYRKGLPKKPKLLLFGLVTQVIPIRIPLLQGYNDGVYYPVPGKTQPTVGIS